jgi:hypothetical protein
MVVLANRLPPISLKERKVKINLKIGGNGMGFNYDEMAQFIDNYFKAFTRCGHDPDTNYLLNEYYAPELEFIPNTQGESKIPNREAWYRQISQPALQEYFTPEHIIIDERQGLIDVLAKSEVKDKMTGKTVLGGNFNCVYELKIDKDNSLKIKKIDFFFEIKPETVSPSKVLETG